MVRKIYQTLKEHLSKKECTILTGARQTGKTTLLKQLGKHLESNGEAVTFLNLERKDILLELDQGPEYVFRFLTKTAKGKNYLLIDEIQYLQDPSNFLKLLYDEHASQLKIVATGSSAFYLDSRFKDSLAGRKKIFELFTLDFEEYLLFKEEENLLKELHSLRKGLIQKSPADQQLWVTLDEYINYGGYPAVVLEPNNKDKIERLYDIRDSFVKRDMLEAGISDETKFYRFLILLAGQIGHLVNINELANTLHLTYRASDQYLNVLQKCFHISLVRPFFSNLRKELVKMPKLYFNDLGLRNALINYFAPINQRSDRGALLENYVYRRIAEQLPKEQIKFWRTADANEVDFIIQETANRGRAIEVKFADTETNTKKYKKFIELYPDYPLEFFTWKGWDLLL